MGGRVLRMHAREHVFVAEIFEVVLLRLRAETAGVISVPGRKPRRRTQDHFVDSAHAPLSRQERPRVVGLVRVPVAIQDCTAAAIFRRRERGIRPNARPDTSDLEIRICRQRLDLGTSDIGVTRQMPNLGLRHQRLLSAGILLGHLAFEEAQIVIVARDWLEVLVPHDFGRDLGIVRIEDRERLPGNVADQIAMVRGEAHLAGIFFGGVLERRRPRHVARRDNIHLHAARHRDKCTRTHERADLPRIPGGDPVAGFYLGVGWSERKCQREKTCDDRQRDSSSARFFHI